MKMRQTVKPKTSLKTSLKRALIIVTIAGVTITVIIYIGMFLLGNIGTSKFSYANSGLSSATFQKSIVIDRNKISGSDDLIDFSLLVKIVDTDLRTTSYGGEVTSNLGYDICFADVSGNPLSHQVEYYMPSTGEYIAWVKVPTLSASVDTEIKLLFGNSTVTQDPSVKEVWNSAYQAVYHMELLPADNLPDWSSNQRNGLAKGSIASSALVEGKIGNALELDGNDDYLEPSNYKGITGKKERTISMWFKTNTPGQTYHLLSWGDAKEGKKYDIFIDGATGSLSVDIDGGAEYGTTQVTDGEWHHLAVVLPKNGSARSSLRVGDHRIYIDGVEESSTVDNNIKLNTAGNGSNLRIGSSNWGCCYAKAIIDEVRIIKSALSSDQIMTEYRNQFAPESFYSVVSSTTLPIELLAFEAQLSNGWAELSWATKTEINNDFFTIEKSTNGIYFEEITTVSGAGNSNVERSYTYTDKTLGNGITYYRLKQTDYNGDEEYFPMKTVENYSVAENNLEILSVGPNPFNNNFTLAFDSPKNQNVEIQLINLEGKALFYNSISSTSGPNNYFFDQGNDLNPGVYFLNIISEGVYKKTVKVIKQ